jgi:DNA-binding response OmpR family regulator
MFAQAKLMQVSKSEIEARIRALAILVVDDSPYEAGDGIAALDAIRAVSPDVIILDWELPLLNGSELVRIVRSPGAFPVPDVPIIMLSAHGERWRVVEAVRLGVNEYLVKPVSAQALYDRLLSIMARSRPAPAADDTQEPRTRRLSGEPPMDVAPSLQPTDTVLI